MAESASSSFENFLRSKGLDVEKYLPVFQLEDISSLETLKPFRGNRAKYHTIADGATESEAAALKKIFNIQTLATVLESQNLETAYWARCFEEKLGVTSPETLSLVRAQAFVTMRGEVRHDWEVEALKNLFISTGKFQAQDFEKVESRQDMNSAATAYLHCTPVPVNEIDAREQRAIKMRDFSVMLKDGTPSFYKLPITEIATDRKSMLRKCDIGIPFPGAPEKIFILLGETGSGKSTLINGMINYLYGVKWQQNFRFKVITESDEGSRSQANSQTSCITSYSFHLQDEGPFQRHTLTLIDTPGFGDTAGIKRDEEIVKQVKAFFEKSGEIGVDMLHGVGFVVKASDSRLTHTQQYIFDSILSLFGKDMEENVFVLITFADGGDPNVLEGLKAAKIAYKEWFKFNNSALFSNNQATRDVAVNEMFWNIGMTSCEALFNALEKTPPKSLTMTKEVLKARETLETSVQGLQVLNTCGLNKLEELKKEMEIIKIHEADIAKNKDFTYEIEVTKARTVATRTGQYVTNCLVCNFTCHLECSIPNDNNKRGCASMDNKGYCIVCPNNCFWDKHKNNQFYYELYKEKELRTVDELKAKYEGANQNRSQTEQMLENLSTEFADIQNGVCALILQSRNCLEELNKIAARPNPLSAVDYIDLLIKSEQQSGKPGWKERINHLHEAKKMAEIVQNVKDPNFDPWAEYKKQHIAAAKPKKPWYQFWKKASKSVIVSGSTFPKRTSSDSV